MRVVVTGGAGFIASHVCEALLARGDHVVAFDNLNNLYRRARKESNLAQVRAVAPERFRFVEGNLNDVESLARCFDDAPVDAVVHAAARAGVRPSLDDPAGYVEVNVGGTARLLRVMQDHGCTRLVFASSSSVYGASTGVAFREDMPADRPVSPYAATKRAAEMLIHAAHASTGLDAVCLRFFTVYGPRQRPGMAFHKFATQLTRGEAVTMYGDGSSSRDYTYVADVAHYVLAAVDQARGFQILNVGGDTPTQLRDAIDLLARALGVPVRVEQLPDQVGDVPHTCADMTRTIAALGPPPSTSIEDGLARFAAWFAEHGVH